MVRGKTEREKKKICAVPLTDSSDDSDVEWTPAIERPRKPGKITPYLLSSLPIPSVHRVDSSDLRLKFQCKEFNLPYDRFLSN